jgi:nucleoside-triphosphatase THEP1
VLVLLSAPIGVGKTTLCRRLAATARERGVRVAGALALPLIEEAEKVGIQCLDLHGGQVRLLARSDRDLGGCQVGPFTFDDQVLDWMSSLCAGALTGDALVFIDEIGPLELERDGGLHRLIPLLSRSREGHTVVVVRDTLLGELLSRVRAAEPRVVSFDGTSRDVAQSEMETLLFTDRPIACRA